MAVSNSTRSTRQHSQSQFVPRLCIFTLCLLPLACEQPDGATAKCESLRVKPGVQQLTFKGVHHDVDEEKFAYTVYFWHEEHAAPNKSRDQDDRDNVTKTTASKDHTVLFCAWSNRRANGGGKPECPTVKEGYHLGGLITDSFVLVIDPATPDKQGKYGLRLAGSVVTHFCFFTESDNSAVVGETPGPTFPPDKKTAEETDESTNAMVIIGVVVGLVLLIALIVVIVRRKRLRTLMTNCSHGTDDMAATQRSQPTGAEASGSAEETPLTERTESPRPADHLSHEHALLRSDSGAQGDHADGDGDIPVDNHTLMTNCSHDTDNMAATQRSQAAGEQASGSAEETPLEEINESPQPAEVTPPNSDSCTQGDHVDSDGDIPVDNQSATDDGQNQKTGNPKVTLRMLSRESGFEVDFPQEQTDRISEEDDLSTGHYEK